MIFAQSSEAEMSNVTIHGVAVRIHKPCLRQGCCREQGATGIGPSLTDGSLPPNVNNAEGMLERSFLSCRNTHRDMHTVFRPLKLQFEHCVAPR